MWTWFITVFNLMFFFYYNVFCDSSMTYKTVTCKKDDIGRDKYQNSKNVVHMVC